MSKEGLLLGLPAVLEFEAGPPRHLYVFNPATMELERIGPGPAGSPLLAPSGLHSCAQIVVFAGDPPDAVTLGGDYVYLAPYQPNFLLGPDGDLTLLEGGD